VSSRKDLVQSARRIVVKVGSSSLTTKDGRLDPDQIAILVDTLAACRSRGVELVLVSSGAIAAGLGPLALPKRPRDLSRQQAAASVGQGLLIHRYTEEFARHDLIAGQVLLTVDDVTRRSHYRNAQRTIGALLEMGAIPIVNENDTVATSEIRFGDNDRLAALVAHLVHADLLILLSDVSGLFDGPPKEPGTSLIPEVKPGDDLSEIRISGPGSKIGTGGMITKLEAASIANEAGIPVVLTNMSHADQALLGDTVGTFFHSTGRKRPSRLLWLAHATEPKGTLSLDEGAVAAICERRASLLPAGVTGLTGKFVAGDPVDLVDGAGKSIARGLVNYDASELPALFGRSTKELARELGAEYEREIIHRDAMVLLK
jgi:glutamate 5-kinase